MTDFHSISDSSLCACISNIFDSSTTLLTRGTTNSPKLVSGSRNLLVHQIVLYPPYSRVSQIPVNPSQSILDRAKRHFANVDTAGSQRNEKSVDPSSIASERFQATQALDVTSITVIPGQCECERKYCSVHGKGDLQLCDLATHSDQEPTAVISRLSPGMTPLQSGSIGLDIPLVARPRYGIWWN